MKRDPCTSGVSKSQGLASPAPRPLPHLSPWRQHAFPPAVFILQDKAWLLLSVGKSQKQGTARGCKGKGWDKEGAGLGWPGLQGARRDQPELRQRCGCQPMAPTSCCTPALLFGFHF